MLLPQFLVVLDVPLCLPPGRRGTKSGIANAAFVHTLCV